MLNSCLSSPPRPTFHVDPILLDVEDDHLSGNHIVALPEFRVSRENNLLVEIVKNRFPAVGHSKSLLNLHIPIGHNLLDPFAILDDHSLYRIGINHHVLLPGCHVPFENNQIVLEIGLHRVRGDVDGLA